MDAPPELEGDALAAVQHRGGHIQIIAAAGSGKTEVVAQRVAALLADGEPPQSIVAFTFTERAAEELKHRIAQRAEHKSDRAFSTSLVRSSSARSTRTASACSSSTYLAMRPTTFSTTTSSPPFSLEKLGN